MSTSSHGAGLWFCCISGTQRSCTTCHSPDESAPVLALVGQRGAAAIGELIHAPATRCVARPEAAQQARPLETMQGGVDRALGEVELTVAALAQALHEPVAVGRLGGHGGQEQHLQMALQYLGLHSM